MPDAGFDGISVLCDNAPSFDLFNVLGGTPQSTGIWTDVNGNAANISTLIRNLAVYLLIL